MGRSFPSMVLAALLAATMQCEPSHALRAHLGRHMHSRLRFIPVPGGTIDLDQDSYGSEGGQLLSPAYPSARGERSAPSLGLIPLPEGMVITIDKTLPAQQENDPKKSSAPIRLPKQAAQQLASCWSPPLPAQGETVEVTLRFGFNRSGAVLWPPRITYLKAGQGMSAADVRDSIFTAFKACTPLRFTDAMAANIPGEPFAVRFIGRRAEQSEDRH
jgi:hypothetical protein